MSNNKQMYQDIDESLEVRAFEEDTSGNIMGCTWPPRSYTCTFCRREFRSAQALGGHMNVHRRDRARLHEIPKIPSTKAPSSTLLIPTQEFVANGLCLFYSFPNPNPNPNGFLIPTPLNPYSLAVAQSVGASVCHSSNTEQSSNDENVVKDLAVEELDLELRLGRRSPQP